MMNLLIALRKKTWLKWRHQLKRDELEVAGAKVVPGDIVSIELASTQKKIEEARKHPAAKDAEYWEGYLAGMNWIIKFGDNK